jgi:arylsulfatase A-like enzyme
MNVILLAIDTLRADHLSCYSYSKKTSPNLDRIAAEGVLLENCFSPTSFTHPSFTTMLTGLYPITHTVVRMPAARPLPHDTVMLPEILHVNGFMTVAVDNLNGGGRKVPAWWFGKGYDIYINYSKLPYKIGAASNTMAHVNEIALPLIREIKTRNFFMFLHCWDTHRTYSPPSPYSEMWFSGDKERAQNYSSSDRPLGEPLPSENEKQRNADMTYTIAQYDGAITYADAEIGKLVETLKELKIYDKTVMIVTSDHGEALGEHGAYTIHRFMYDPSTHIPLIFRCPQLLESGMSSPALTHLVDIPPTILDLLGIDIPDYMEGQSLKPVLTGETDEQYHQLFLFSISPNIRRGIRTHTHKFIKRVPNCPVTDGWPDKELYNLKSDPSETRNIVNSDSNTAIELENLLDVWTAEKLKGRVDPLVSLSKRRRE